MTGDGGLIALSVAEAWQIMSWGTAFEISDDWTVEDETLYARIQEWHDRHVEMKARLTEIDAYISRHSEATP